MAEWPIQAVKPFCIESAGEEAGGDWDAQKQNMRPEWV